MKRIPSALLWVWMIFCLAGCSRFLESLERSLASSQPQSPQLYEIKAKAYERRDELQLALFYWKIAARLKPDDDWIQNRIVRLKGTIEAKAAQHFQKAMGYYRENCKERARLEFLVALRYDPDHEKALDFIKNRLNAHKQLIYKVEAGDTLKGIAEKVYQDSSKDFLVAYFMDVPNNATPVPGNVVLLPLLDPAMTKPVFDVKNALIKAERFLLDRAYRSVARIAEDVLDQDPMNPKARELRNQAYYEMGKQYTKQERYLESMQMFRKVDAPYGDVETLLSAVSLLIEKEAEEHYRRGVNFFVNEELQRAIREWEACLRLNPGHKKARDDIANARNLINKLEEVK